MRIQQLDASDRAAFAACHEVVRAALAADDPLGPPSSARSVLARLTHPVDPLEVWYAPGERDDEAVGVYTLTLPAPENRDRAELVLDVHPSFRRRGIGGGLLRHAAGRAAQNERAVLTGLAIQDSAGAAFARRAGAAPGLLDARRVLVLAAISPGHVAAMREEAARAAAGYSLVSWSGQTPDEYLAGSAAMRDAMNDAPRDAGREGQRWDAGRVRERVDAFRIRQGRHIYTLAVLHAATGEMAAITEVEVHPENPQWADQLITAVSRPHRGHRLGLLAKTAMLDWLATAEPALERIVTWNAAVNQHMIAINEALGYQLLEPQARSYELAVADVRRESKRSRPARRGEG